MKLEKYLLKNLDYLLTFKQIYDNIYLTTTTWEEFKMKNYVLVMKKNGGLTIGKNSYTKDEAELRQKEMLSMGIEVDVMRIDEVFSA